MQLWFPTVQENFELASLYIPCFLLLGLLTRSLATFFFCITFAIMLLIQVHNILLSVFPYQYQMICEPKHECCNRDVICLNQTALTLVFRICSALASSDG